MPDISKFIDLSSLFVALNGLLFATWFPVLSDLTKTSRPPMYSNRKAYITAMWSGLVTRALPLFVFLAAYVISLSGVVWQLWCSSSVTLNPANVDPVRTLFALTYLLSIYLAIYAAYLLLSLLLRWWRAGEGRGANARITLLR